MGKNNPSPLNIAQLDLPSESLNDNFLLFSYEILIPNSHFAGVVPMVDTKEDSINTNMNKEIIAKEIFIDGVPNVFTIERVVSGNEASTITRM